MKPSNYQVELKLAKRCFESGDPVGALFYLNRAREWAHKDIGPHKHKKGILVHRRAVLEAGFGDNPDATRRLFKRAIKMIEPDAPVELAMALRDYGNFELQEGDVKSARMFITRALALLDAIDEQTERVEIERAVTRGFLARTNLEINPMGAIKILRQIATLLRGYKKREYELDNLDWLIDYLPFGAERQLYTLRALQLSILQGNKRKVAEYGSLFGGGKPLRGIWRIIF